MTEKSDLRSQLYKRREALVHSNMHKKLAERAHQQKLFWRNRCNHHLIGTLSAPIRPKNRRN